MTLSRLVLDFEAIPMLGMSHRSAPPFGLRENPHPAFTSCTHPVYVGCVSTVLNQDAPRAPRLSPGHGR